MARDRIPLDSDDEDSDEPLTADPEHLKARMDKSHMPDAEERRERRRDARTGGRQYIEQQAVQMLIDTLREKGVSDSFIRENMDTIRKKALNHLYGRE